MASETKPCPYCAEEIAAEAIKCKHCGTMLAGSSTDTGPLFDYPPAVLTIPMIVSAGWNLVTAVTYVFLGVSFLPCIGLFIAIPYVALAVFEIVTFQRAPTMSPGELYDRCGWLGGFQILLGLTNVVPVICGIFLLVYRDRLREYQPTDE